MDSTARGAVLAALDRRTAAAEGFADEAEATARACHDMAARFHAGGSLLVFGSGGPAADAQHVAVEFVHPVIVGKRALPALSLANDVATLTGVAAEAGLAEVFAAQLRLLAGSSDIALGLSVRGDDPAVSRGLQVAGELGLLTIALTGAAGTAGAVAVDHRFVVAAEDPCVAKEVMVTTYHVLWELVHVYLEQPGLLGPGVIR